MDLGISNLMRLPAAAAVAVVITLSGCGRSAPDGFDASADTTAAGPALTESGDQVTTTTLTTAGLAGVRVISERQIVPTVPTTSVVTTPPSATTAPAAVPASTYVVQPGDTLSVIAEQFGISVADISAANGIGDVDRIKPGQELIIPAR